MVLGRFGLAALAVLACWASAGAQQSSPEFDRLFIEYRGTEAALAIREFATWSEARVAREARLAPHLQNDPRAIAALAMFHTEAGIEQGTFGSLPADPSLVRSGIHREVHYRTSFALMERLDGNRQWREDAAIAAFMDDWFLAAHVRPDTDKRISGFESFVLGRQFRRVASAQLLLGIFNAASMGPMRLGGPVSSGIYPTVVTNQTTGMRRTITVGGELFSAERVRDAELAFGRALEVAPRLAEARLRLGRVQQVTGRTRDARANLEGALGDAKATGDRFTEYLAGLFLGRLHEDAKRFDAAVDAYLAASRVEGAGSSAWLGMGQVQLAAGRATEAWATIRRALEFGGEDADGWTRYTAARPEPAAQRWPRLRAFVSATPYVPKERAAAAPLATPPDSFVRGTHRPGDGGLAVVLVLDTSGSTVRATGRTVLDLAGLVLDALQPADSVAIVTASDRIALRATDLDVTGARTVAGELAHDGSTRSVILDAALASRALVADRFTRPLVVVISDGADNASWYERARALDAVARGGIPFDGIEMKFGIPRTCDACRGDGTFGEITLRPLVARTGGRFFLAESEGLADRLVARMAELRQASR